MVITLVMAIQWSLGEGMVDFVNQKELNDLAPLTQALEQQFAIDGSWQAYADNPRAFRQLLESFLVQMPYSPPHLSQGEYAQKGRPPRGERPPRNQHGDTPANRPPRYGSTEDASHRPPPRHDEQPPNRPMREMSEPSQPAESQIRRVPAAFRPTPRVSFTLMDENIQHVAGLHFEDREYAYKALYHGDKLVGHLGVSKRTELAEDYELNFLDKQEARLFQFASVLVVLTFLVSLPLAHHLVSPIKRLSRALSAISKGHYDSKLATKRRDEFELLYNNVNHLADTLASNQTARERWFADTAHDLRTPVAILRGELEAMQDGIRPVAMQQIDSLHSEILRLERFIGDLHELARSELGTQHYQKEKTLLNEVVLEAVQQHTLQFTESQILMLPDIGNHELWCFADGFRLNQCLDNILNNIVKYASGATRCHVSLHKVENRGRIIIEDDGIGVESEHYAKLFDHLYRVDASRNRKTAGSGLGLAICKNIITAHNGDIYAKRSTLGGLAIIIELTLVN